MIITEIRKTKNAMRYHLYIDDKFYGIFLDETLARYSLKTGQEIDSEFLNSIKEENDGHLAFQMALSYLEKYNVSKKGIKDYLKRKNLDKYAIQKALEKLESYGYVNDEVFAKNYFESLKNSKGKRVIINKLKEKGVQDDIIGELIETISDEDEEERSFILAKKFAKNRENNLKNKQKCLAHLIYKGYSYSVAQKIANKVFTEDENDWS